MKFAASFLFFFGGFVSVKGVPASNHTKSANNSTYLIPHRLHVDKISRIMRTEATRVYTDDILWDELVAIEQRRLLTRSSLSSSNIRRSMSSLSVTPFLVCEMEHGTSGEARKQLVSETLGTSHLSNVYNKDDMSCFALQASFSNILELPNNFQSVPILPEMKIPDGILDAIENSDLNFGRVEAILCPVSENLRATVAEIEQLVKRPRDNDRRLRVSDFARARRNVGNAGNTLWHRLLEETANCDDWASAAMVDVYGDSLMFGIPQVFRGENWRSCLQVLVIELSLQEDVCFVGAYEDPQILNDVASGVVQSGSPESKPFYDVELDGTGQVVAISDSGIDVDNCYFFDSTQSTPKTSTGSVDGPINPLARKVIQYVSFADDSDYTNGHGTHVAGSIAGRRSENGVAEQDGAADGVARSAKLALFDIGKSDEGLRVPLLSTVFATGYQDAGARVHSASWGSPNQNSYSSFDHHADSFMFDNTDFLFVVAAGNNGRDRTSTSIASPGLNKNGITVGACQNSSPHISNNMLGPDYLAEFSSRGPTGDGRRKPDVVAPGLNVQSARAQPESQGECDNTGGLLFKAGSSMATPIVSGTAALVRQYFEQGWHLSGVASSKDGFSPRASLVKAVLVNGAVELEGIQDDQTKQTSVSSTYDMNQGFGRVNLLKSLPISGQNTIKGRFFDSNTVATGDVDSFKVTIDGDGQCNEPLSVSLVWTDPPIGPLCSESCVLNDLDLTVTHDTNGATFYPNGLSGPDDKNNVERIRIEEPSSGSQYTVNVRGRQLIEPQTYSLVITGCLKTQGSVPIPTPMPQMPPTPSHIATFSPTSDPQPAGAADCVDTSGTFSSEGNSRNVAQTCPSTCQECKGDFTFGNALETTSNFAGTVRFYGNAFEIQPHQDITLLSLGVHLYGSSTATIEVWIRSGGSTPWNQMCQSTVTSQGRFSLVSLPETDCTPVDLAAGSVSEIYVTVESSKAIILVADSAWTMETNDLTLSNGAAVAHFDGTRVDGYGFDGSIRYARTCQDQTSTVVISDWAGARTCDWLVTNWARMAFSCEFSHVVLHCPSACGRCVA